MGYYVIYKDILIKENNKLILLESGCDNNTWPKYKDHFSFKVFNDTDEYIKYTEKFNKNESDIAYINGKFINGEQYKKRLLNLLKHVETKNDYVFSIRQLMGYENKENEIYITADEWAKKYYDPEFRNKYREMSFKIDYKELKLKDLKNDMARVQIVLLWKNKRG